MRKILVAALALLTSACSVLMVIHQPGRKDLSVLSKGVDRPRVIAELGSPLTTETMKDGGKIDTFAFFRGYTREEQIGQTFGHAILDLGTLGMWEAIATPIEAYHLSTKVKTKVEYDKDDRVTNWSVFKGEEKVDEGVVPSGSKVAESGPDPGR